MADDSATVQESGGEYTSLETALATEETDLSVLAGKFEFIIGGAWTGVDTNNVDIGDWGTSSATEYVRIYTTGSSVHDGTNFGSSQYSLEPTGTSHCIVLDQEFTRIEGLPIKLKDNPSNSSEGIRCDASSDDSTIDKCIIWHEASDTDADGIYIWNSNSHDDNQTINIYNTIIHGFTRSGINCQCYVNNSKNINVNIRSVTIWDCGSSGEGETSAIHMRSSSPADGTVTCNVDNTIGADAPVNTDFFATGPTGSGTITWNGNYNACTTAAGPMPGANSLASRTTTDSASPGAGDFISFVDITTNIDLHMLDDDDNDMRDAGLFSTIPASPYAADIDGDTRADPPEIGADEISAAAPAAFTARVTMF